MSNPVVHCVDLSKSYHDGHQSVDVLRHLNFSLSPGERVAIVGPSGSGKSTLLHLLGGLDNPTEGHAFIQNCDWQTQTEKKKCQLRNQHLGFIYQFHHLLPEFSALENVAMPLLIAGHLVSEASLLAREMLDAVGLNARIQHKPAALSGGERQRVAIARALVHQPSCVFADEPTGNLDQETALRVFDLMQTINQTAQTAFVVVTHDQTLAQRMERVLTLQTGQLRQMA